MSILGNFVSLPGPQPDWAQTDSSRADYIKNKPSLLTTGGGQLSGPLDMGGSGISGLPEPAAADQAANKAYADSKLALSGGTMTGPLDMGGYGIGALAEPAGVSDAATKGYVDGRKGVFSLALGRSQWVQSGEGWECTAAVSGLTGQENLIVSPEPNSFDRYSEAGVRCVSQGAGSLGFWAREVPEADLTVQVLVLR